MDPNRFAVRAQYLAGVGRMPWLTWRSRAIASLYNEMAEATETTAPGVVMAVVTPGLDRGAAGTEARRVDRAGLAPSHAWRSVGLDLQAWRGAPALPRYSVALRSLRIPWRTTLPPAPTSMRWSRAADSAVCS